MFRRRARGARRDALPIASALFAVSVLVLAVLARRPRESGASLTGRAVLRASAEADDNNGYHGFCTGDGFLKSKAGLALYFPAVLVMFVGLAIVTDDFFVPALEAICEQLQLTEDVAGATFMAAGSSAPELFTSFLAVFVTEDDVGVGTIVGSAVFNILVIIGLSAALAGKALLLDWRSLARDSFFYVISIVALIVVLLGPSRGVVDWWEALIMVLLYGAYIAFMKFGNAAYFRATERFMSPEVLAKQGLGDKSSDVEEGVALGPGTPGSSLATSESAERDVFGGKDAGVDGLFSKEIGLPVNYKTLTPRAQFRTAYLAVVAANRLKGVNSVSSVMGCDDGVGLSTVPLTDRGSGGGGGDGSGGDGSGDAPEYSGENGSEGSGKEFLGIEVPEGVIGKLFFPITFLWSILFKYTIYQCGNPGKGKFWPVTFVLSVLWIGAISYAMVESARMIGCLIGIPSVVMGLTVLAAGTSVPDALASVAVARMGQADMAVSNAIGSNVFDILLGLGIPWLIGALAKEPQAVTVDPLTTVIVPVAILFVILVLLVGLLIALRWTLRPLLGYILFGLYVVFVAYNLLDNFVFKLGQ